MTFAVLAITFFAIYGLIDFCQYIAVRLLIDR